MGKRLSQLNQIERNNINQEDYLLIDGDGYLESKKTKLKDIDIDKFNTEKFYNKQQTDDIFVKKEEGKGLSTNDFTDEYKDKIENSNGSGSTIDIEIEKIEGGHKVSIIDDEEVESFNVMDGKSGVYVGSGDMPEGYNVQIDPDGEALDMNTLATKEYVDSAVSAVDPQVNLSNYPTKEELAEDLAPIQQSITDMSVDYIVEQGNNDIWTWEKWNSGKAVCWCKTITSDSADPASIYFKQLLLPFEFTNDNYIVLITSYQSTGVGSFAFQYYKRTTTEFWVGSNDPSITANVYVIGKWK